MASLSAGCGTSKEFIPAPEGSAHADEPVVLLHGLGRMKSSMRPLARSLNEAGYPTLRIGYPSLSHPIEDLVEDHFTPAIESLPPETRTVHFVGHSLGNILVRDFLQRNPDLSLGRVVQLAPPNHGSLIARWLHSSRFLCRLLPPAMEQIRHGDSEYITGLPQLPEGTEFLIVLGDDPRIPFFRRLLPHPHDGIVSHEQAVVPGASAVLTVPSGHTTIMRHPETLEATLRFLESGEVAGE